MEWTQSGPATQLGQARELLHVAERREAAGNLIGENPRGGSIHGTGIGCRRTPYRAEGATRLRDLAQVRHAWVHPQLAVLLERIRFGVMRAVTAQPVRPWWKILEV